MKKLNKCGMCRLCGFNIPWQPCDRNKAVIEKTDYGYSHSCVNFEYWKDTAKRLFEND